MDYVEHSAVQVLQYYRINYVMFAPPH